MPRRRRAFSAQARLLRANFLLSRFLKGLVRFLVCLVERDPAFLEGRFQGCPGLLTSLAVCFQLGFCSVCLSLQMGERCVQLLLLRCGKGGGLATQRDDRLLPGFALRFGTSLENCLLLLNHRLSLLYIVLNSGFEGGPIRLQSSLSLCPSSLAFLLLLADRLLKSRSLPPDVCHRFFSVLF